MTDGLPSSVDVLREIPIVKCSGGKLLSQRVQFVRSTFDWAVCSEPLAFAADAGLWVLNGRYALRPVRKR
jgi:hypothetical protein